MINDNSILPFPGKNIEDTFDEIDLNSMSREALSELLKILNQRFDALQNEELDDPDSPECLKWLGVISDIEDMMDEVSDLLEE